MPVSFEFTWNLARERAQMKAQQMGKALMVERAK